MADDGGVLGAVGLDYPRAVLLALAVAVAIALVVVASTSGAAFGAYNQAWDGAAGLRSVATDAGAEPVLVRNTSEYGAGQPARTVAVVLSPDRAYGSGDLARLRRFVRRGGTLVVAEDFGPHGNAILEGVGAEARFDGSLLRDDRNHYRAPALPVVQTVTDRPLTDGVEQLTLNHGTPVRPGNATVLARTSGFAYVDANRDGGLDESESLRSRPVMTVERIDGGRVVAVGDPSLFINAMLDRPGNRAFVGNLFGARQHALLDYSHASGLPPLALAVLLLRKHALLQLLVGGLGIAAIAAWTHGAVARLRGVIGRDAPRVQLGADDLRAYLERRHPDWEDERVERVIRGVLTRESQSGRDERSRDGL